MSSGDVRMHRYLPREWEEKQQLRAKSAELAIPSYRSGPGRAPILVEADSERPVFPVVYPLAILVAVILMIVGVVEAIWLIHSLMGLWVLPHPDLVSQLGEKSWQVAQMSPAVLALPAGAWLLVKPGMGRFVASVLLGCALVHTLLTYDPVIDDTLRTNVQAAMLGAVIALLWVERAVIGGRPSHSDEMRGVAPR